MYRKLLSVTILASASLVPASASIPVQQTPVGSFWLKRLIRWPISFLFGPRLPATIAVDDYIPPVEYEPCLVLPLADIAEPEALEYEQNGGSVRTSGLAPAASMALTQFESLVSRYGGTLTLTSAYRPQAYQDHLQDVWDKWMLELRDNEEPGCEFLRSQVYREFAGHGLLETQRPASISDHSRGTAFDAAVILPDPGRKLRRRVNIDALARRAGLYRPVRIQDPVHFRLRVPRKAVSVKFAAHQSRKSHRWGS